MHGSQAPLNLVYLFECNFFLIHSSTCIVKGLFVGKVARKTFVKILFTLECCFPLDVSMDFEIVSTEECQPADPLTSGTGRQEMYKKLETDLVSQIKMCQANRIYFKTTGDVPSANKFHQMEEHTKKDLDTLRFAFRRGDPVPKFHYEVRSFSKVVLNPDLTDNEIEINVVQAINLQVGKDAHTYCK